MIAGADGSLKDRLGRAAYLWTGARRASRAGRSRPGSASTAAPWYNGPASCILAGNVGSLFGGVRGVRRRRARRRPARPGRDHRRRRRPVGGDGRPHHRRPARSARRYFRTTKARKVKVKLDRKVLYELDGGARTKVKAYRLAVEPGAIAVRVPHESSNGDEAMSSSIDDTGPLGGPRSSTHEPGVRGAHAGRLRRPRHHLRHHRRCSRSRSRSTRQQRPTNQRGALETIQRQPFGHWLLIAVAVGLGGYALWRFVQASSATAPRAAATVGLRPHRRLASGIAYPAMCALAVSILLGTSSQRSSNPHNSAAGVLGWPGGQYIVGAAGVLFIGVALYQGYKGVSRKFLEEDKTDQMGPFVRALDHPHRRGRPPRPDGGIRPDRHLRAQGGDRLRRRARPSASTARWRSSPTRPTATSCSPSPRRLIAFGLYSIADARYRRI